MWRPQRLCHGHSKLPLYSFLMARLPNFIASLSISTVLQRMCEKFILWPKKKLQVPRTVWVGTIHTITINQSINQSISQSPYLRSFSWSYCRCDCCKSGCPVIMYAAARLYGHILEFSRVRVAFSIKKDQQRRELQVTISANVDLSPHRISWVVWLRQWHLDRTDEPRYLHWILWIM
jgi:hypothetical protein